jgi:hypothetical protein
LKSATHSRFQFPAPYQPHFGEAIIKQLIDIYLVSGNITVFFGQHTEAFKKDILHTSLCGHLLSQKLNDGLTSWSTYTGTLKKLDWIGSSSELKFLKFENSSLLNIIDLCTGKTLKTNERAILDTILIKLARLPSDVPAAKSITNRLELNASDVSYTTGSRSPFKQSYATSVTLTIVFDNKKVATLQVSFKTDDLIGLDILTNPTLKALDEVYNSRLLISTINEHRYNTRRAQIAKKLGDKMLTELLHITDLLQI